MSKTAIGHFMNQKAFHPANFQNQKRVWIAEQKAETDKKRKDDRDREYAKEQALFETKSFALFTKEQNATEVARRAVNFMYEAPPGLQAKKEGDEEDEKKLRLDEKFDFLKGAPRPEFAKGKEEVRDRPFGMEVRNVQCLRCRKWGHQHIDKACPLYAKLQDEGEEAPRAAFDDPAVLMQQMQRDGLVLTQRALGRVNDPSLENQMLVEEEEEITDADYVNSLSKKEKKKLLKRIKKLEKKEKKSSKKKKHKKHHHGHSDDGASSSDSGSSEDEQADAKDTKDKKRESGADEYGPARSHDHDAARASERERERERERHGREERDDRGSRHDDKRVRREEPEGGHRHEADRSPPRHRSDREEDRHRKERREEHHGRDDHQGRDDRRPDDRSRTDDRRPDDRGDHSSRHGRRRD